MQTYAESCQSLRVVSNLNYNNTHPNYIIYAAALLVRNFMGQ